MALSGFRIGNDERCFISWVAGLKLMEDDMARPQKPDSDMSYRVWGLDGLSIIFLCFSHTSLAPEDYI
jgi:hypothetical protein